MTRRKDKEYKIPIVCTGCYEEVDRFKLKAAIKADQTFIHFCGKVLHWSREGENAEVPPHNHVLFDPNPKSSGSE
jgi:hypothetical protein